MNDIKSIKLSVSEKYVLTKEEAMAYFNIGEKKMRFLIQEHIDDHTFVVCNGRKYLIIRNKFEDFLDNTSTI